MEILIFLLSFIFMVLANFFLYKAYKEMGKEIPNTKYNILTILFALFSFIASFIGTAFVANINSIFTTSFFYVFSGAAYLAFLSFLFASITISVKNKNDKLLQILMAAFYICVITSFYLLIN